MYIHTYLNIPEQFYQERGNVICYRWQNICFELREKSEKNAHLKFHLKCFIQRKGQSLQNSILNKCYSGSFQKTCTILFVIFLIDLALCQLFSLSIATDFFSKIWENFWLQPIHKKDFLQIIDQLLQCLSSLRPWKCQSH